MAMDMSLGPEERAGLAPAAVLFHSLADPVRLAILQHLTRGEARVVDLTRQLGLAQSTVSKHLACLRDCRLVDFRAEGRQSFYSVSRPELVDLLRSAEGLLGRHRRGGGAVPGVRPGPSGRSDVMSAVELSTPLPRAAERLSNGRSVAWSP